MGLRLGLLTEATGVLPTDQFYILRNGTTDMRVSASFVGTGGGGGGYTPISGSKIVSTATYTWLNSDNGMAIEFTNPAGCFITIPTNLSAGVEGVAYAVSGALQFATGGVGVALPRLPVSLSASTQEAFSVAAFKIETNTNTFILEGDLNAVGPDAITDGDFNSNGRMIRNGLGNYNTILDNLSATSAPFTGSDYNAGYRVGSFWINQMSRSAYLCLDDTPNSASFHQLDLVSDIDYDLFMGNSSKGVVYFRDDFVTDIDLWTSTLVGAGASISILNAPTYGELTVTTGTTFTGSALIRIPTNVFANSAASTMDFYSFTSIVRIFDPPTDATNPYIVRAPEFVNSTFQTDGLYFSQLSGNYGVDNFWAMTRLNSGVSSSVPTSVLALTGVQYRLRIDHYPQKQTASYYINNVYQGQFTGSQITTISSGYLVPLHVLKLTGTSARRAYLDYTACYGLFTGSGRV